MNSFRILMASSDPEYDRAFAAWLEKKHPPFKTDLLDPQRWFDVSEDDYDAYDRILLGGKLKHIHDGPGVRVAGGFGPKDNEPEYDRGIIDPFRPAEAVFRDLINDPGLEIKRPFSVRTMGIALSDASSALLIQAAENIIAALAYKGRTILMADLREFPANEPAVFRRDGERSWDDFLYSCIYARNPDLLTDPERYAGRNDWGILRFPMSAGPNPYRTLNDRELRMMYGRIREYCPVDYFAAFLPEPGMAVYGPTLMQMDLILFLYRDSETEREQLKENLRAIKSETDPSKRILEICISDRYDDRDLPGFLLHLKEGDGAVSWAESYSGMPPEDLSAIAEFIQDGCYV